MLIVDAARKDKLANDVKNELSGKDIGDFENFKI